MTARPRPEPTAEPAADPAPSAPWPPSAPGLPRLHLDRPGDLVAAVPVLVGFHPRDSLVLVALHGGPGPSRVGLTVRVDLPRSAASVRATCADAVAVLAGARPARAYAVVVRATVRRDVARATRTALRAAGIEPVAVLWATGTRAGDRWEHLDPPGPRGEGPGERAGVLSDPASAPLGVAAAVHGGRAVLPDRAAVLAQLDPGAADVADQLRRARLLAAGSGPARVPPAAGVELVDACLDAAAEGRLHVGDRLALALCRALAVGGVRDEALRRCLGSDAPHAEQLWAVLVRALPSPERAHPLALLAVCALLRGDGALATGAVERALRERPDHVLASVVATCLHGTLAPGSPAGEWAGPAGLRRLLTAMLDPEPAPGSGPGAGWAPC
ncbi:DUF4192 domain-containing protein [Pseudonocardia spirodelae]|uniref:DUF4192 domain-containing protein n=1 Tax=Pseudonocardia spirodelae TaxID=3133431 RepID=A0ABU8T0S7_9PSEU